jgi:hypothetical protein
MAATSQLFRRDDSRTGGRTDRGQAEVLGAILLFGILIALLVLVQVAAVPGWNQQLEYEHSLRLQEDMREFESAVDATAASGTERTVVVETGVQYPQRPFLLNPPPAMGALETTGPGTVAIQNGALVGVDNYWSADQQFTTTGIRYRPSYNEYQNAPVTYYENGYLYRQFESGVVRPSAETNLVEGDQITLLLFDGELSTAGEASTSVTLQAASAPTQSVPLRTAPGSNLVLRLPTQANETTWRDALSGELDGGAPGVDDDPNRYVDSLDVVPGSPHNTLVVELEPAAGAGDVYSLRMANVGLGDQSVPDDPHYVTATSDTNRTTSTNRPAELSVEVRDRFNNPSSNVHVEFEKVSGVGAVAPTERETDDDGEATTTFVSAEAGQAEIRVRADLNDDGTYAATETETFDVTVVDSNVTGMTDGVSGINPGAGSGLVQVVSGTKDGSGARITLDNDASSRIRMTQIRVSYYFDSEQQKDYPSQTTFVYGDESEELAIPGEFEAVDGPTLEPDGQSGEQKSFLLDGLDNNPKNDFLIMSVIFVDENNEEYRITYFVGIYG